MVGKGADLPLMGIHLRGPGWRAQTTLPWGEGEARILWKEDLNELKGPFQFQTLRSRRNTIKLFL